MAKFLLPLLVLAMLGVYGTDSVTTTTPRPAVPWTTASPEAEEKCFKFCGNRCAGDGSGGFELDTKNPHICDTTCRYGCPGAGRASGHFGGGGATGVKSDLARAERYFSGCDAGCYDSCFDDCKQKFNPYDNMVHVVCVYYCTTGDTPGKLTDGDYILLGGRFNKTITTTTGAPPPDADSTTAQAKSTPKCPCDKGCEKKCEADCAKQCNTEGFWLDAGGPQVCLGICQTECALTGGNVARIDDSKFKKCATKSCFEPCNAAMQKKVGPGHPWNACILNCITRAEGVKPEAVDCPMCPFCQFQSPCDPAAPKPAATPEPMMSSTTAAPKGKPARSQGAPK